MLIRDCIINGVFMERREDTPVRLARRKYEEKVKEKRREKSGTFGTMIPRTLFNEINAFLKETGYTKVQLVKAGYKALLEERKKLNKTTE